MSACSKPEFFQCESHTCWVCPLVASSLGPPVLLLAAYYAPSWYIYVCGNMTKTEILLEPCLCS